MSRESDERIEDIMRRKNIQYFGRTSHSFEDYLKEKNSFVEKEQVDMSRKLTLAHSELELVKNDLALERSIIKWYGVIDGTVVDHSARNCPLCKRFRNTKNQYSCNGCHVKEKSGENDCGNTPYEYWVDHHIKNHGNQPFPTYGIRIQCPKCYELAVREVNFLKSLVRNPVVLESKEGIKKGCRSVLSATSPIFNTEE